MTRLITIIMTRLITNIDTKHIEVAIVSIHELQACKKQYRALKTAHDSSAAPAAAGYAGYVCDNLIV